MLIKVLSIIFLALLLQILNSYQHAEADSNVSAYSQEEEIQLALSAAPESMRKDCAVYVFKDNKYVKAREGSNGFSCIVYRDSPGASEPLCYDKEGAQTNMVADIQRSELRKQGMSEAEIDKKIEEGYRTGKFKAPSRPGIVYMLSEQNFIYNAGRKAEHYPPHLMFYAPYMKNADIGAGKEDFGSTLIPWVLNEGTPSAYIIVVPNSQKHQH